MLGTLAPMLEAPVRDAHDIAGAVRAVTGVHGLAGIARPPSDKARDLIGIALAEVLRSVLDAADPAEPEGAAVELWVEPTLAIIAVRFAGPPLPGWLLANWDRGEPPARLAPPGDSGWGWLMVREALESASQHRTARGVIVFLEKRL